MEAQITLITFLTAATVGFAAQRLLVIVDRSAAARLAESEQPDTRPKAFTELIGSPIGRLLPKTLRKVEDDLYWAAFEDRTWAGKTAAAAIGRQVLMGAGLGVAAYFATKDSYALLAGLIAGWMLMQSELRSKAETVRKRISQELPETLQLMAAEGKSGAALHTIIQRVSEGEGYMAAWLRYVLHLAHGRNLFSPSAMDEGVLRQAAEESGHPLLIDFAVQLGFAGKGTQVEKLLTRLAENIGENYRAQADQRAEQLSGKLGLLAAVFYIFPFLVILLAVIGTPLVRAF